MSVLNRRYFLQALSIGGVAAAMPRVLLADADTEARFVFIILRGALDGLAAVAPYGDGNYSRMRGELTLSAPGVSEGALKLDGLFALHPSLANMHARYREGELIAIHAVASPYRERSHFDGQDLLENGTLSPHGSTDGWLNRALTAVPATHSRNSEQLAFAFAQNIPLVLRGSAQVGSWAPSRMPQADADTLERVAHMYESDEYFASRLRTALAADAVAGENMGEGDKGMGRDPLGAFGTVALAAGRMLHADDGPRIAVLDVSGWDTHANQGAGNGQLANRLAGLDRAIDALRSELDAAWKHTVVLIATEFGRTVAINGTRGTDHGTATCAFLIGGAVNGGRVVADWPGLASNDLYQNRDLKPTLDLRSVCKGVLASHLRIGESHLESTVFPESRSSKPLQGLIRI